MGSLIHRLQARSGLVGRKRHGGGAPQHGGTGKRNKSACVHTAVSPFLKMPGATGAIAGDMDCDETPK
jgi:hypothetical protein